MNQLHMSFVKHIKHYWKMLLLMARRELSRVTTLQSDPRQCSQGETTTSCSDVCAFSSTVVYKLLPSVVVCVSILCCDS